MKRFFIIFLLISACFSAAIYFDFIEITPKGMKYLKLIGNTIVDLAKEAASMFVDLLKKGLSMLGDALKSIFDELVSILKKWFSKITG